MERWDPVGLRPMSEVPTKPLTKVDTESVRFLAKAGARLRIKSNEGYTAEDIATNTGKKWPRNSL